MNNLIKFNQFGQIQKPINWLFIIAAVLSIVGIGVIFWFWYKAQKQGTQPPALPKVAEVKFSATITPNPTEGLIALEVDFQEEKVLFLTIYDRSNNAKQYEQELTETSNSINLSFLMPGLYQAIIKNEATTKVALLGFEKV